jgi:conjugal transfer pilin signal peptidase TrbI
MTNIVGRGITLATGLVAEGKRRGWIRQSEGWWLYFAKAFGLLAIILGGGYLANQRWAFAIDPQVYQCLPGTRLIMYERAYSEPKRGQIFAFEAHGLKPFFPDGTKIYKVVDGVPGDKVEVSPEGVRVNGRLVVKGLPLVERLNTPAEGFSRSFTIPPRYYLMLGRAPMSYDGRYWGLVQEDDMIGRAYQFWKDWER